MAMTPKEIEEHFEKMERVAEEALCDQQEIIDLDKKRNANREALRQIKFNPKHKESQSWICLGNTFLRLPKEVIIKNIEQDQEKLENGIKNLRNGLRDKIDQLNTLEGKPLSRGTGLKALDKDEWDALKEVVGLKPV